ncbi:hypothetical protein [Streptomyces sp. NBC_00207]|uniref:hypothetical protein n=1 Tax=unclassified Streptomyces TaxID=2593676 RepID=UPI0028881891|nr:hypothetical protein [Streptomyces sp. DSM 41633]
MPTGASVRRKASRAIVCTGKKPFASEAAAKAAAHGMAAREPYLQRRTAYPCPYAHGGHWHIGRKLGRDNR